MWFWTAPFTGEYGGPFQTEAEAKAGCITFLSKREPHPDHVEILWQSCERGGWGVEFRP